MQTTFTTTETFEDILARLSDDDRSALETWCMLSNRNSVHLGGPGQSPEQIRARAAAWDALSPSARWAFISGLCSAVDELASAIREMGIPEEAERDIDAIEALLGPDHPALRILPAYALVSAYKEAMEQTGN